MSSKMPIFNSTITMNLIIQHAKHIGLHSVLFEHSGRSLMFIAQPM